MVHYLHLSLQLFTIPLTTLLDIVMIGTYMTIFYLFLCVLILESL